MWKVANERDVKVNLKTNLIEVQGDKNTAIFASVDNPNEKFSIEVRYLKKAFHFLMEITDFFISLIQNTRQYSILHATPPQSVPQVLLDSKNITNESGFVEVNQQTLQHIKYPNIFALG